MKTSMRADRGFYETRTGAMYLVGKKGWLHQESPDHPITKHVGKPMLIDGRLVLLKRSKEIANSTRVVSFKPRGLSW